MIIWWKEFNELYGYIIRNSIKRYYRNIDAKYANNDSIDLSREIIFTLQKRISGVYQTYCGKKHSIDLILTICKTFKQKLLTRKKKTGPSIIAWDVKVKII